MGDYDPDLRRRYRLLAWAEKGVFLPPEKKPVNRTDNRTDNRAALERAACSEQRSLYEKLTKGGKLTGRGAAMFRHSVEQREAALRGEKTSRGPMEIATVEGVRWQSN